MKKLYLLSAVLLITGFSFGQLTGIPIDDGTPIDSKSDVNQVESNSTRGLLILPDYYNYNTNGSNNSFPWNIASGKEVQLLYLPGDFNQPSPAPAGNITSISFRIGNIYPLGPATFTDLTIKMGQSTITSFTSGSFYPGTLTTVYYKASVTLTGTAGAWMFITLDTPFAYDPTQSLIIDIGQCGVTGTTGFSSCFTNIAGNRRMWSVGGCPLVYSSQNASVYHIGINYGTVTGETVTIGTGTNTSSYPYYTFWMDARCNILYTAAEIAAGSGLPGNITGLAFHVSSAYSYLMNGFNIRMQATSATSLTGFTNTGWTDVYSGTYTVPATGWQQINFTTPFNWDGTSNLLVEICWDNTGYSSSSPVYASSQTGMTWGQAIDNATGCDFAFGDAQTYRPNIRLNMNVGVNPSSIPVSNWALFIGIGLILVFAVVRFRRIV